jgi:hypothetical protein
VDDPLTTVADEHLHENRFVALAGDAKNEEVTDSFVDRETVPGTSYLSVFVPEKLNIDCELNGQIGGSITLTSKVEGDVRLITSNGDIAVTKLRGHKLHLASGGSNNCIYVRDLIEASSIDITSNGRFRAKQIHGSSVSIQVEKNMSHGMIDTNKIYDTDDEGAIVDISSMYVSGTGGADIIVMGSMLNSVPTAPFRSAIRVKSSHGPVRASVSRISPLALSVNDKTGLVYPLIELGGVNGSCDIINQRIYQWHQFRMGILHCSH